MYISFFHLPIHVGSCNGGFVSNGEYCYAFIDRLETWVEAGSNCRVLNAYLAEPRSQQESDFVKQLVQNHTQSGHQSHGVWLGGEDQVIEGKWFWAQSGAPVDGGFTNWKAGEPNSASRLENCMEYYIHSKAWNDAPCNFTLPFICQKDHISDVIG